MALEFIPQHSNALFSLDIVTRDLYDKKSVTIMKSYDFIVTFENFGFGDFKALNRKRDEP